MIRDHMDEGMAAALREHLVGEAGTARAAAAAEGGMRRGRVRTAVVTAVVAAAVLAASGAALVLAPRPGAGVGAPLPTTPCEATVSAPFDCHVYVTTGGSAPGQDLSWLATSPVDVQFEHLNGELMIGVDGPVNGYSQGIDVSGRTPTSPYGPYAGATTVGCYRPNLSSTPPLTTRCGQDVWLSDLLGERLTYEIGPGTVTIRSATSVVSLRATNRVDPLAKPKSTPVATPAPSTSPSVISRGSYCPQYPPDRVAKPTAPGAADRLVPFVPTSALVCGWVTLGKGSAEHEAGLKAPAARSLAALLNTARPSPFAHGTFNCPNDDGARVDITFGDGQQSIQVLVSETGCGDATNGAFIATVPAGFDRMLALLAPSAPPPR